jgi:hypothetical protein
MLWVGFSIRARCTTLCVKACQWFAARRKSTTLLCCTMLFGIVNNRFPTMYTCITNLIDQGRIQDFKLGGTHLKKLGRAEGGAKIFGVFRVKNHDFTPKNRIFSDCGGRRENFWGISCEKSRFYDYTLIWQWMMIMNLQRSNCSFIWSEREAEKFRKPWHLQMPLKTEHFLSNVSSWNWFLMLIRYRSTVSFLFGVAIVIEGFCDH